MPPSHRKGTLSFSRVAARHTRHVCAITAPQHAPSSRWFLHHRHERNIAACRGQAIRVAYSAFPLNQQFNAYFAPTIRLRASQHHSARDSRCGHTTTARYGASVSKPTLLPHRDLPFSRRVRIALITCGLPFAAVAERTRCDLGFDNLNKGTINTRGRRRIMPIMSAGCCTDGGGFG